MERVTGIGGVFFKAKDPKRLHLWYERHLGIKAEPGQPAVNFRWSADPAGTTVWCIFPDDTKYFGASPGGFMLNYRVRDLDSVLEALHGEGIEILGREDYEYGKFAWIADPEGNRIELWQPLGQ